MASTAPHLPDARTGDTGTIGPQRPFAVSGRDRLLLSGVAAAGFASALLLLWALRDPLFVGVFLAAFLAAGALIFLFVQLRAPVAEAQVAAERDEGLTKAAIDTSGEAVAITDRAGGLVCASTRFGECFPGWPTPPELPFDAESAERLHAASRAALRDGSAVAEGLIGPHGTFDAAVDRAGSREDHLLWRFRRVEAFDLIGCARALMDGEGGRRLGEAGVMGAIVDGQGQMLAANQVFLARAVGRADVPAAGRDFVDLLAAGADDLFRLAAEGEDAGPLRLVQIPLQEEEAGGTTLFLMLDEEREVSIGSGLPSTATAHIHTLLAMLPLGLALAERDGRLLFMNEAFERAAGLPPGDAPIYPGDLVVKEDKAAVSDAVRRFAAGQRLSGDLAVRLVHRPEEPVALTIAGARGLGNAAVLLSLKDSSEENRLKRQVAQATKMQAVGQLAGGVAHDFNNILTAILGHCDLMLMRHTPGEADYDDIQQIRHNSNRAAGLTRQLLAFSRQQTLRPQVLQLPDVVSETSNLLKRLLNEQVDLVVKHGRGLGPVRADPGQLEQVIVNLAVNARDAMPEGGTLTIQTFAVGIEEVRALASEIMPTAEYTALSVSDTGTGIAPEIIGKVFEPFFTTKEVGKGTGLGLSTVYGIVKQSGGFIFADSQVGKGTSFVVYLPVHRIDPLADAPAPAPAVSSTELWGSGTILLVEDEDMVRAVAERALVRQGYHVLTAANGEEALELLGSAGPVDLLISDVMMPTMDGPTLVSHARQRFPDLPILFMSGYAEETLRRSIDLDHVAFLPKPFSVRQLAEAARDALVDRH